MRCMGFSKKGSYETLYKSLGFGTAPHENQKNLETTTIIVELIFYSQP